MVWPLWAGVGVGAAQVCMAQALYAVGEAGEPALKDVAAKLVMGVVRAAASHARGTARSGQPAGTADGASLLCAPRTLSVGAPQSLSNGAS